MPRPLRPVLLGALLALIAAAPAAAAFAPIDHPGPVLSVPEPKLRQALTCTDLGGATRDVAIFLPGTTVNPRVNFGWNWFRVFDARGWPRCAVELPGNAMEDIQDAGQYVAYAIRRVHALTGRKVDLVGHSQGGMVGRWALRFWPDTRGMVDDLVGLAPSNHGTVLARAICAAGCAPAIWQQRDDSRFMAALNSGQETFAPVSYTAVYTHLDEVVVPNGDARTGSSSLRGGTGRVTDVATQDLCPLNGADHLAAGTYDPVAAALALDALTHDGPVDPRRVPRSICAARFMPGVDAATFAPDEIDTAGVLATTLLGARRVPAEPALQCYTTGSCPASREARLTLAVMPRRVRAGRTTTLRLRALVVRGDGRRSAASGAIVRLAGSVATLDRAGRGTLRMRVPRAVTRSVVATLPAVGVATARVRVTR